MKDIFDYKTFGDRLRNVEDDLSLNRAYIRGQSLSVKNCWHISSDGNYVDCMFRDAKEFTAGMNRAAAGALRLQVIILAMCLMDNHIHFVLYGEQKDCEMFAYEFLRLTAMENKRDNNDHNRLSHIPVSIIPVKDLDYLQRVICYDIQNPSAGKTGYGFYDYPWSSGPLYFRKTGHWTEPSFVQLLENENKPRVLSCGEMSVRQVREVLATRVSVPADWKLIDGMIFPGYYVPVSIVEKIFRSQRGFKYSLSRLKESEIDSDNGSFSRIRLNDAELREHRNRISLSMFGHTNMRMLDVEQRIRLAKALKNQFHSSPRQIATMVSLPFKEIDSIFSRL